jgi:hypothetical protein
VPSGGDQVLLRHLRFSSMDIANTLDGKKS